MRLDYRGRFAKFISDDGMVQAAEAESYHNGKEVYSGRVVGKMPKVRGNSVQKRIDQGINGLSSLPIPF